ncbi:ATP-binding cassette domain-containing protein [Alkalibaculum sp. M08DMB]|uniref:ATP-binding cassette domain-containing protein n=1 Tax=Alkalibaculum sporogenes TaxID=2655001 RepID=A0A6A7K6R2_9FIRM|nr:ATP-binding cassette domain-containing protein [Alkalibaculum sporogenes]
MSIPGKQDSPPPGLNTGGGGRLKMALPHEKPKDFKKTLLQLLQYIRPYRIQLIIVVLASILGTVFSIFSPVILGQATTIIFEGVIGRLNGDPNFTIDFNKIIRILQLLASIYFVSAMFIYLEQFIMASVAQKIVYDMRNDIRDKLSRLPLKYFDSHTHGEILSRATNDMDTIGSTLQQSISQFIVSIITIIGILVMMTSISAWMTVIALITLPLTFIITKKIARISQKNFASNQRELGKLNSHVEEMYGSHIIVKAFGNEKKSIQEFKEINKNLTEAGWRSQFISGLIMPLVGFLNNIGYVLICVVGSIFVTQGRISIGNMQAFIQYSKQFSQPILQTANIANIIQSTIAAAERVFELMNEPEETPDSLHAYTKFRPKGDVKFEEVSFSYYEDIELITKMNIEVKSGQTIAIVGPTGAGKTTLVKLLLRFYEIKSGSITIDGVDIRDIQRGTLREVFGMVLQDTWLFKGTIKDNIAYGRMDASDEEIIKASKAAHADHFIRTLPHGYETVLNEEASNISQGQKQLLTIARAILSNPTILILDEATSSVDTRTELLIQKAMIRLMKGRTNFVIAHRLSTIRDADVILVMNEGKVVEVGTHLQLLAMNGFYDSLYNSQFNSEVS